MATIFRCFLFVSLAALAWAAPRAVGPDRPRIGSVERLDPRLDAVLAADARLEVLAEGFDWAEGPVWLPDQQALLFSDVPANTVYRWSEADGLRVYLRPSGQTGHAGSASAEGSNGLALDPAGRLVLCQHGDRRLARMEAPLDRPAPDFATLAERWEGVRLNSPNDLTIAPDGTFYFTDPTYGLGRQPSELGFKGVYRLSPDGSLALLDRSQPMPNGIALSPDGRTLYVANTEGAPSYVQWSLAEPAAGAVPVFSAAHLAGPDRPGSPDGMKVHPSGLLFATGPGGVLILDPRDPAHPHLGTILTGRATANCAFDATFSALYLAADDLLLRVALVPSP